jgi:hypothetical protein
MDRGDDFMGIEGMGLKEMQAELKKISLCELAAIGALINTEIFRRIEQQNKKT